MNLQQRINAFAQLGKFLSQFTRQGYTKIADIPFNELFFEGMSLQIKRASEHNGWFTSDNILYALEGWTSLLTQESLLEWLEKYAFAKASNALNNNEYNEKEITGTIAVIMAGNIPLVGFHDFLCVLITGNSFVGKLSSNDEQLLPLIAKYLEYVEPSFKGKIKFTKDSLPKHDAVIATGSDNTARYFKYYFGQKPHIIRKNRNSVAILTGLESPEELARLGEDIFRYYGLGCRNVSKLFVPEGYDFDKFFKAIYTWKDIITQAKYANNYDYNKAVYLMSLYDLLENGFLMLKEDTSYGSPIATLFYEFYSSEKALYQLLFNDRERIQCIVQASSLSKKVKSLEHKSLIDRRVQFGMTQKPTLSDYADGVDTIAFLLNI